MVGIKKYEFGIASNGIMSTLNFMNICPAISVYYLLIGNDAIMANDVTAEDHPSTLQLSACHVGIIDCRSTTME
jgi:hypothetical protein